MQAFFRGIYNHHHYHHIQQQQQQPYGQFVVNTVFVSAAICLFIYLHAGATSQRSAGTRSPDWRCHGERCYVTPVDIQEDAAPALAAARRRGMDDNFQLGDAGAVKNVSGSA